MPVQISAVQSWELYRKGFFVIFLKNSSDFFLSVTSHLGELAQKLEKGFNRSAIRSEG